MQSTRPDVDTFPPRGWVFLPPRTWIEFSGADRAKFLHNFCTADVNTLQAGAVTEAFVLDSRGKALAFGHILTLEERIFFTMAAADGSGSLIEHFHKYLIRESVVVKDVSSAWGGVWITAIEPDDLSKLLQVPMTPDSVRYIEFTGVIWIVARLELAGPGWMLMAPNDEIPRITQLLDQHDCVASNLHALETRRIEAGTPWYGRDIDASNLPQEIRRDEKAISFRKGCYLGQETVAKIDALGHVNRFLVGLAADDPRTRFENGSPIMAEDLKIGQVTSAAYSPGLQRAIGLGYVKRQYAAPGTPVEIEGKACQVVALPIQC